MYKGGAFSPKEKTMEYQLIKHQFTSPRDLKDFTDRMKHENLKDWDVRSISAVADAKRPYVIALLVKES